jgi:hypothetical protein
MKASISSLIGAEVDGKGAASFLRGLPVDELLGVLEAIYINTCVTVN